MVLAILISHIGRYVFYSLIPSAHFRPKQCIVKINGDDGWSSSSVAKEVVASTAKQTQSYSHAPSRNAQFSLLLPRPSRPPPRPAVIDVAFRGLSHSCVDPAFALAGAVVLRRRLYDAVEEEVSED